MLTVFCYCTTCDWIAFFFENGGQLYLYAEDLLTLQDAKRKPLDQVLIPPPKIIYGLDEEHQRQNIQEARNREHTWNKAHLLPVQVPPGTPELGTLQQEKDLVLEAVRGGYSAAFDLLAPIVGLEVDEISGITGSVAASLVFPEFDFDQEDNALRSSDPDKVLLQTKVNVPGDPLLDTDELQDDTRMPCDMPAMAGSFSQDETDMTLSHTLLSVLPGFQGGRLHHLAKGLRQGSSLYVDSQG